MTKAITDAKFEELEHFWLKHMNDAANALEAVERAANALEATERRIDDLSMLLAVAAKREKVLRDALHAIQLPVYVIKNDVTWAYYLLDKRMKLAREALAVGGAP